MTGSAILLQLDFVKLSNESQNRDNSLDVNDNSPLSCKNITRDIEVKNNLTMDRGEWGGDSEIYLSMFIHKVLINCQVQSIKKN